MRAKFIFEDEEFRFMKGPSREKIREKLKNLPEGKQFEIAISQNIIWLVKEFLDNGFDISYKKNWAIKEAAIHGDIEIIKLLLNNRFVNAADNDNAAIENAIRYDHYEITKLLFSEDYIRNTLQHDWYNRILFYLERRDHDDINEEEEFRFMKGPSKEKILKGLEGKSIEDKFEIVRKNNLEWLLVDCLKNGLPIDFHENHPIRTAAARGWNEIVDMLMKDPKVDPSDENNLAIYWARTNHHEDTVKMLLKDERVIEKLYELPDNRYYYRLLYDEHSDKMNEEEEFKWIKNSKSYDILKSFDNKSIEVIIDKLFYNEMLDKHPFSDYLDKRLHEFAKDENYSIRYKCKIAVEAKNLWLFNYCIKTGKIDFVGENNFTPFGAACAFGWDEMVKYILEKIKEHTPHVLSMFNNAIWWAHANNHKSTVKILLDDDRTLLSISSAEKQRYYKFINES